ncbi:MAG: hypothetical protein ACOVNL_14640 [Prochlorococcaceae cyanobacterium]|jgi:hypothetical protein
MLHIFLSSPRSGSTRLGQIIALLGIEFVPEPFHPECKSWGFLGAYNNIAELALGVESSSLSRDLIRADESIFKICKYLDRQDRHYMIEIFPGHVEMNTLSQLLSVYPSIFLQRRLIDQFISLVKARSLGESGIWADVDTTSLKPRLCANAFIRHCQDMIIFYSSAFIAVSPRVASCSLIIDYEYYAGLSDDEQVCAILSLFTEIGLPTSKYHAKDPAQDLHDWYSSSPVCRQDSSLTWGAKIINRREFLISLILCRDSTLNLPDYTFLIHARPLGLTQLALAPFRIASTSCA